MGLVHEVCAPDALDASVEAMLETVVQNGPAAVRLCKQLVRDVESRPIDDDLRAETARRIADIRASDEGKEGLQSFLNKRPPNWLIPRA
jgi:methylglutaconyl-CoA hydratase